MLIIGMLQYKHRRWFSIFGQVVVKTIFLLFSMSYQDASIADEASIQIASPGYAKWGKIAVEETAKAYEGASIVDYKYEGRFSGVRGSDEERFLLWLKQEGREFGVRVTVTVHAETETLVSVKLKELRSS